MTCLKRLNDNLGQTLSDLLALSSKVRYFSWNIKGHQFYSVHTMLQQHHKDLETITEKVVTSIFLNGYPNCFAGFKYMASIAKIQDGNIEQDLKGLINELLESYDTALMSVEKVHKISQQQGNHAVVNLLTDGICVIKKHMWHLRSTKD